MIDAPFSVIIAGTILGVIIVIAKEVAPLKFQERVIITGGFWEDLRGTVVDRRYFLWYTVNITTSEKIKDSLNAHDALRLVRTFPRWRLSVSRTDMSQKMRRRRLGLD